MEEVKDGRRHTARCRHGPQPCRNSFSGLVELNRCVQGGKPGQRVRQRFNKRCLAQSDSRRCRGPRRQRALRRWWCALVRRFAAGRWIPAFAGMTWRYAGMTWRYAGIQWRYAEFNRVVRKSAFLRQIGQNTYLPGSIGVIPAKAGIHLHLSLGTMHIGP
jgi:hypothetical protein